LPAHRATLWFGGWSDFASADWELFGHRPPPAIQPLERDLSIPAMAKFISGIGRKLLTLEQWCVGWAPVSIADFLEDPASAKFSWLEPSSPREILADPFGIEENGNLIILAEQLEHGTSKGHLVRIDPQAASKPTQLLARPFHLSYPFLVEDGSQRYVVPEQAESGTLAFYPLTENGIGKPAAAIEGLDAIDPTFLHRHGLWWLFCTRASSGPNGPLFIYYAETLLGPYRAHPENPIVTNCGCTRPAGRIIRLGETLLRPAQDCASSYGAAIVLCEIETLTTEIYRERPVRRLEPGHIRGGFPSGLHTLDHTAHFVLLDTKRFALHALAAPIKLATRLSGSLRGW
jgi:hypothetical protein